MTLRAEKTRRVGLDWGSEGGGPTLSPVEFQGDRKARQLHLRAHCCCHDLGSASGNSPLIAQFASTEPTRHFPAGLICRTVHRDVEVCFRAFDYDLACVFQEDLYDTVPVEFYNGIIFSGKPYFHGTDVIGMFAQRVAQPPLDILVLSQRQLEVQSLYCHLDELHLLHRVNFNGATIEANENQQ
jgi:hypothetical protein